MVFLSLGEISGFEKKTHLVPSEILQIGATLNQKQVGTENFIFYRKTCFSVPVQVLFLEKSKTNFRNLPCTNWKKVSYTTTN